MRIDHHVDLLSKPRTLALKNYLFSTVRRGDRVLDAGTGSGVLAVWAAQAGAREVIAVDREHSGLVQALAQRNGVGKKVQFIEADLTQVSLPDEPFDGIFAMIYENDPRRDEAASRFTKRLVSSSLSPGGWLAPNKVQYLARLVSWPVQLHSDRIGLHRRNIKILASQLELDLSPLLDRLEEALLMDLFPARDYRGLLEGGVALGPDSLAFEVDNFDPDEGYPDTIRISVTDNGQAHAVIWTQNILAGEQLLFSNESVAWLPDPLDVVKGQELEFSLDNDWRKRNVLSVV